MTEQQLKDSLNTIYSECLKTNDVKKSLAKAVQLGMNYQKEKIKEGIDIVFKEL